jgi:hypothetical protein
MFLGQQQTYDHHQKSRGLTYQLSRNSTAFVLPNEKQYSKAGFAHN